MPPPLSRLLLLLAGFARLVDAQGDCMPQGSVAIFMVYQAENPDSVFFSEDGCLAGGGRGTGCCAGAQCRVCEPNQVTSAGVSSCAGTRASANPARRGACSSGWARTRASSAPPGRVPARGGADQLHTVPAGDVQPVAREVRDVQRVSARDVLQVRDPRVCEATTKLYRAADGTEFDDSAGATSCTECPAGTYQPSPRGRNADSSSRGT